MNSVFVVGDIHGQLEKLTALLRGAALIDARARWSGGANRLWLVGDLTDRGPDGIGAIELLRRLQEEARAAGGMVESLLGNHDILLLAVARFGGISTAAGRMFYADWEANGGNPSDLARLTTEHVAWLTARPAMALDGATLLIHGDAPLFLEYGDSPEAVTRAVGEVLRGDDAARWDHLFIQFCERGYFAGPKGEHHLAAFLDRFDGERVVHGHTPIPKVTRQRAPEVREPLVYANGRAINVDGGMYLGGPGFVYQLPAG